MSHAVICFTRVPRPGRTKTRLLPLLAPKQCEGLHTAFLRDLASVYETMDADLFVAYAPDPDPSILQEIFPMAKGIFPQEGADLGAKMCHAIETVLARGYDAYCLTGSDLPLLTAAHLSGGFDALTSADITLGPTSDGGYYLVGMKKPCPEIFANQTYGGATVWENTLTAIAGAGYTFAPAPACEDVDTPEDLKQLWAVLKDRPSHTAAFLSLLQKEGVSLC
ncbi:MAG: TIGR04282 family arsenosugar biosynthesis glycosyltransferase [Clostridia bacterium]|nr:TIGR04282 family arsenosugar biosynthesis glycosyltransferase [Clostridia bacterium]